MAYAVGHVSGGHFNPAVTVGLAAAGRFAWREVGIPVDNTSVYPARSTGPALFAGTEALAQLWVFWLAPVVGAAIAGFSYAALLGREQQPSTLEEASEA